MLLECISAKILSGTAWSTTCLYNTEGLPRLKLGGRHRENSWLDLGKEQKVYLLYNLT